MAYGTYQLYADDLTDTVIGTYEMGEDRLIGVFALKSQAANIKVDLEDGEYTNLIDGSKVTGKVGTDEDRGKTCDSGNLKNILDSHNNKCYITNRTGKAERGCGRISRHLLFAEEFRLQKYSAEVALWLKEIIMKSLESKKRRREGDQKRIQKACEEISSGYEPRG